MGASHTELYAVPALVPPPALRAAAPAPALVPPPALRAAAPALGAPIAPPAPRGVPPALPPLPRARQALPVRRGP
jgi:hypothetical protein